jgi:hypothetical protein
VDSPETVQFRFVIVPFVPVTLLRCLRRILDIPLTDSVLLFNRENEKQIPSEQPIDTTQKATIQQLVRFPFLYYTS